ncbi:polysaccharide deacetylase family protein [Nocardioides sp. GXQ0305]|uniref:polysaccharide deacetylase family protein n=1 Tax=Nocardioides sp. GXQ0305 TaxID=3423912 RepID=UPI003D7E605A
MSRATLRRGADRALRRSPAQLVFRRRSRGLLAVLAYHGVDDPAQLRRQLDHVVEHWTPVSLEAVLAALDGSQPLPRHSVLVTFDDGFASVLDAGLPLLRERGVPAVAFVLPGLLDGSQPFWWTEAERLHAAGARAPEAPGQTATELVGWLKTVPDTRRLEVLEALRAQAPDLDTSMRQLTTADLLTLEQGGVEIGNHTWSHPCLDRCSTQEAERQVEQAHEALTRALGRPPRAFAYPNGNHDLRAEEVLRRLGYRAGFLFDHRLSAPAPGVDPLRLSRVRTGSDTSLDRYATILSGLHPAVHRAAGRR